MCTTSSPSGKFALYLANIDALSDADMMPGAEFAANAVTSCIFWATDMKTMKMSADNKPYR